jgi:hypothetical protein
MAIVGVDVDRPLKQEGLFQLLYVLHTSRTDAQLGRYEAPT